MSKWEPTVGTLSAEALRAIQRDLAESDGWYRFTRPGVATRHIAHVSDGGSVYLPEPPDFVTESDFHLASGLDSSFHQLVDKHYATDLLDHIAALTKQLEHARLEQELAAADTAGRREFGARALFLQFMKPKQWRTKAMWSQGVNDACRQEWLERWDRVELEIRDAISWALVEAADGEA